MNSQYKTKGMGWTAEEEEELLKRINQNLYASGNVCWMGVRKLKDRTLSSMTSHWKVMRRVHIYDGKRWFKNDKETKKAPIMNEARTVKQEVIEFLKTYPNSDNHTTAQFVGCTSQYVSRLRKENNLPSLKLHKAKQTIDKTPEVKREEFAQKPSFPEIEQLSWRKRSFLWGVYTDERYE